VLNCIYEEVFLGFSYGFRPKRGQHDALDALAVGITDKKVNFILNAGVRSFFDGVDPRRTFRRHGAHAVAIASHPHILRAGGDELQMTLDEIIDQSASSRGVQATSSYPATQEVNCIRSAGRAAPWRPAGPACRSLR
jgi:hypothetical protein